MKNEKWHQRAIDDTLHAFNTSINSGLSHEQVEANQSTYGLNALPAKREKPKIIKFFGHFNDILIYVLLVAAAITGFLGHFLDMSVIILVAVINAIIGYVQESRAEKALESIRKMMTSEAVVIRDGRSQTIPGEQLTIGDIVILSSGEKIPANLRLLITYVPFFNTILKTAPLTFSQWVIPLGIGTAVFILIEIEKWITRNIFKYEA